MPYIKPEDRPKFESAITEAVDSLTDHGFANPKVGEVNYFISSVLWRLFKQSPSYQRANDLMGALNGVDKEFYRRVVAPYEDEKIKENGDI